MQRGRVRLLHACIAALLLAGLSSPEGCAVAFFFRVVSLCFRLLSVVRLCYPPRDHIARVCRMLLIVCHCCC